MAMLLLFWYYDDHTLPFKVNTFFSYHHHLIFSIIAFDICILSIFSTLHRKLVLRQVYCNLVPNTIEKR